ncbi:MAG TPA: carboxypeptidase regulatory-like domain-containing protein [Vulgatibacter sp.]|nr:carboxypeptidase regulatory-like domain-containing protein [Vulgatibacter sp.]
MRLDHRWLGLAIVLAATFTLGGCSSKKASPEEVPGCDPRFVSASGACDAGAVEGTVRLGDGEGHAGVRIRLDEGPREAVTGDDGRFWFDGVEAGDHTLHFSSPIGEVARADVTVAAGEVTEVGPVSFDGKKTHARVEGRILLDGADEHGGTIVAVLGGPAVAITRADGSFAFPGLANGRHTLLAEHVGYVTATREIEVAGEPVALEPWTLLAAPVGGTIAGRVTLPGTGAPAVDATVIVAGAGRSARTDGDGAFSISNVPAGTWEVRAGLPGFGPAIESGVVVEEGRVTEVALVVTRTGDGSWVVGRALRLGESGHAGIEVTLTAGDDVFTATTGADGTWEIEGISEGLYDLHASFEGYEPESIPGVPVVAGPNAGPEVVLGRAMRIVDRFAWWSMVLPRSHRVLYKIEDPDHGVGAWLYDLDSRSRKPLFGGDFHALGLDEEERYFTLMFYDDWSTFHRFTIEDGTLEPITPGNIVNFWDWPGVMFLQTDGGDLHVLRPGEVEATPLDLGCQLSYVDAHRLDEGESDAWATVRFETQCSRTFFSLADLEAGFVGFPGDELLGASMTRGVSIRWGWSLPAAFPMDQNQEWDGPMEAWWVDLEARENEKLSDSISAFFGDVSLGVLGYAEELDEWTRPLTRVNLATGEATLVSADAETYLPAGPRLVMAVPRDPADPLRWYALDGPESGVLCDEVDSWYQNPTTGVMACIDWERHLYFFDPNTRTRILVDEDATLIDEAGSRFIVWLSSDGRHHLVHFDLPMEYDWEQSPGAPFYETQSPGLHVLSSEELGTLAIDMESGATVQITPPGPSQPFRCEVSPSMSTAVCQAYCDTGACGTVHNLGAGTSVDVGSASGLNGLIVSWAPDEASVAFGKGFVAHRAGGGWTGGACDFPLDPRAVHTAERGESALWEFDDESVAICHPSGQIVPAGHLRSWRFDPTRIPGMPFILTPEGIADLENADFVPFDMLIQEVWVLPEGVFAHSDDHRFIAFRPTGPEAFEYFQELLDLGGRPYLLTSGYGGSDLWAIDSVGITRVARGVEGVEPIDEAKALVIGRMSLLDGIPLSILRLDTNGLETLAVASPFAPILGDEEIAYFETMGGELVRLRLRTAVVTSLAEEAEMLDMDEAGRLYFAEGGVVWQSETEGAGRHGVLPWGAAAVEVVSSRGEHVVLGQSGPDATYYYEAR